MSATRSRVLSGKPVVSPTCSKTSTAVNGNKGKKSVPSVNCPCTVTNNVDPVSQPSRQNADGAPAISCLVFGSPRIDCTTFSRPRCKDCAILSTFPTRDKFREPPFPPLSQTSHLRFFWLGSVLWSPWIRARGGIEVLAENEKVAAGWYASTSPDRCVS